VTLRITEIFYSLQGESNLVGLPTVFIRLTGCPLRCSYCDTAYAFHGGEKMEIKQIIETAEQYGARHITVTGGEPMAQAECIPLMQQLLDKGFVVSLETSGALDLTEVDERVIKVMDLKTPSSNEQHRNLYSNIDTLDHKDQVKFVIGGDQDYQWAKQTLEQYHLSDRCEVLFSPSMGKQDPTELADKILADRLPVRFQVQLHKLLWGDSPGR
jgi:7-carboxy-7-deazaguanine synthase